MKLEKADYRRLNRDDRALAKLALIARHDCYSGSAKAMVIARRLNSMGTELPVDDVVSAAYSSTTGTASEFMPYECPECGSACLGETEAYQHCFCEEI